MKLNLRELFSDKIYEVGLFFICIIEKKQYFCNLKKYTYNSLNQYYYEPKFYSFFYG